MPETPRGKLSFSRPAEGPSAPAPAPPRVARRASSCLQLAAPTAAVTLRRSRAKEAMAAGQVLMRSERHGPTHTIALFGELDACTAPDVEAELISVEATGAEQIVLDLSGLTFMDTSGVHLIVRADERCKGAAKRLRLVPGPASVRRVFDLAIEDAAPFAA